MSSEEEKLAKARRDMVAFQLAARGIHHPGLLKAFGEIPRERFIPSGRISEAYADYPIPIGCGQTISQPLVVAMMIQEMNPRPTDRVLDIGSGSGYQTAILAKLVREVYAIERIEKFTDSAIGALAGLNITNVTFCTGDGTLGWPEEAPFDQIICGAGAPEVPKPWLDQLADGGRIVLPVGGADAQTLIVLEKDGPEIRSRQICDVRFVKLIGRKGWPP